MATLAPPTSQKAGDRPISFLLDNQADGAPQAFVDLVIRPEDLTRTDTSRLSVQQTIGGAYADNFGKGVPVITISGHTGWRRTASSDDDGLARFQKLKENVFDQWHEKRLANIAAGIDPNGVRLIFSDALDDSSVVVAPMNFVLRRSKSRPLLAQFQINMTVLDTALQNAPYPAEFGYNGAVAPDFGLQQLSGLQSLTASLGTITSSINGITGMIQSSLVGPVQGFMQQTSQLYGAVQGVIGAAAGTVGSVIQLAQTTAAAGANIFRTLAAVASIPQFAKASLMAVAGAYTNIFCVCSNALQTGATFSDYSALYGSSNCSSTSGGRPLSQFAVSGANTFAAVSPLPDALPFSISQTATSALQSLASVDTVLSPPSLSSLPGSIQAFTGGLNLSSLSVPSLPSFSSLSGGLFG